MKCVRSLVPALALLVAGGIVSTASATDITLPDTGIDIGAYITAAITALAAPVGVAIGGWFAWLLIRKAIKWARKAL